LKGEKFENNMKHYFWAAHWARYFGQNINMTWIVFPFSQQ